MKFALSLAFQDPLQAGALSRAAEEAGFERVILSDHVVHPERIDTPYPYTPDGAPRWEPFTPWPDPWVTIGHLAASTEKIRFVTGIYVLPLRNPFVVAKAVGTAAVLSGDRVELGIGAGWMREEFELLEQPFARRGRRMDEMLEVLEKLWAGGMVGHEGEFYRFEPLEMSPVPSRPIPIWCGGLSEPALRRAATRCDGWISDLHTTAELGEIRAKLDALRAGSDRAGRPFAVLAAAKDAFDLDGYRRVADAGVTHLMTMPWVFYAGATDDLEKKLEGIRRFGDDVIAPFDEGRA
ncbi:MAG: TIGR03619 family F420-dependent LLM class oxidoreductase [Myxococcota bacterium]|nr:TIGR03619 family F420-dependent LLM class oxidoreductase [Myxococcota bacterium]